jgi:hypothetical protein
LRSELSKTEKKNYCETCSERLSFTIQQQKIWRPDMNDSELNMRTLPTSPSFHSLCKFPYHFPHATGKTLTKTLRKSFISLFSLQLSPLPCAPHCLLALLSLVHYRFDFRSLNINLRVASCSQNFPLPSGSGSKKAKEFIIFSAVVVGLK